MILDKESTSLICTEKEEALFEFGELSEIRSYLNVTKKKIHPAAEIFAQLNLVIFHVDTLHSIYN